MASEADLEELREARFGELEALTRVLLVTSREKHRDALDEQDREAVAKLLRRLNGEFEKLRAAWLATRGGK